MRLWGGLGVSATLGNSYHLSPSLSLSPSRSLPLSPPQPTSDGTAIVVPMHVCVPPHHIHMPSPVAHKLQLFREVHDVEVSVELGDEGEEPPQPPTNRTRRHKQKASEFTVDIPELQ